MCNEWAVRFVDSLQAVECPVCGEFRELRRKTFENPEMKMQARAAFQSKHESCYATGVKPTLGEKLWTLAMARISDLKVK